MFLTLLREVDVEWHRNAPDAELSLAFVKSGYLMRDKYRRYGMMTCGNDSTEASRI